MLARFVENKVDKNVQLKHKLWKCMDSLKIGIQSKLASVFISNSY